MSRETVTKALTPLDRKMLWRMFRFIMRMLLGIAFNSDVAYFDRVRDDFWRFAPCVKSSVWASWEWDEDEDG